MTNQKNKGDILNFLKILGFKAKDGTEHKYSKIYSRGYEIIVDFNFENLSLSKIN